MYTQIFLVTSVWGIVLPPQIFANASLSFFGAKMPFPAFFMANAPFLPAVFFSAVIFFKVAFVIVVFVVFATVVFATVLVVVVIAIEGRKCKHALSLEP